MSEDDPIKTGIGAAAEALMKPINDLLEKIAGPAAEEIGLTFRDSVKVYRFKRQLRLLRRTQEMLQEAGLDANRVPLKLIAPLVENGSLEEDDNIQDVWARLLANASGRGNVSPAYPEILKQLSSDEVLLLEAIAKKINTTYWYPNVPQWKPANHEVNEWRLAIGHRRTGLEMDALLQNVARLGLIDMITLNDNSNFYLTELGLFFLQACREPKDSNVLIDQISL